jgi:cyclophilin family peptidyl-prolyl cis-trans isomerase
MKTKRTGMQLLTSPLAAVVVAIAFSPVILSGQEPGTDAPPAAGGQAPAADAPTQEPGDTAAPTTDSPVPTDPAANPPASEASSAPAGDQAPAAGDPVAPPDVPADEPLPTDYEGLLAKWEQIRTSLVDLRTRFEAASELLEKDSIRVEYTSLLTRASNVIDRLRDVSLGGLTAENLDPAKLKTLLGIMLNDANEGADDRVLATAETLIALGVPADKFEQAARIERLSIPAREMFEEILIRQREFRADDLPRAKITTNRGVIEFELYENEAPNTVANFITLAKAGFYNGLKFHRVLEGFMAQGGDPNGDGTGGPGYTIPCECVTPEARRHFTGVLSMAKAPARDSGGSQFFITFSRNDSVRNLDGQHTVFGRVIAGQEVLDKLTRTHESTQFGEQPIEAAVADTIATIEIVRDRGHEYKVRKTGEAAEAPAETTEPPPAQPENPPADAVGEGGGNEPALSPDPPMTGDESQPAGEGSGDASGNPPETPPADAGGDGGTEGGGGRE